jgi:hypothetical protein
MCSDNDQTILIKLHDAPPLEAEWSLVQCFSECARNLLASASADSIIMRPCSPQPARTGSASSICWDLTGLLIDGTPARRETVIDWLNMAYHLIHNEPYLKELDLGLCGPPQRSAHMPASRNKAALSARRLLQLLVFADAVGSSKGLMAGLQAEVLQTLHTEVHLPAMANGEGGRVIKLPLDRQTVYDCIDRGHGSVAELCQYTIKGGGRSNLMKACKYDFSDRKELVAIQQETCSLIEQLLCQASKADNRTLLTHLLTFLRHQVQGWSLWNVTGLFGGHAALSEMVLVALSSSAAGRHIVANTLMHCGECDCPELFDSA